MTGNFFIILGQTAFYFFLPSGPFPNTVILSTLACFSLDKNGGGMNNKVVYKFRN